MRIFLCELHQLVYPHLFGKIHRQLIGIFLAALGRIRLNHLLSVCFRCNLNQVHYLPPTLQILRAGKALIGSKPKKPIFGWFSPIYGKKVPALSIRYTVESLPPIAITSKWTFIDNQN